MNSIYPQINAFQRDSNEVDRDFALLVDSQTCLRFASILSLISRNIFDGAGATSSSQEIHESVTLAKSLSEFRVNLHSLNNVYENSEVP